MKPPHVGRALILAITILAGRSTAVGQVVPRLAGPPQGVTNAPRPDEVVLSAMRSNPLTASYPIMVNWQKGKVILSGRVGTKQVHDAAVRMAIDIGVPFRDDLVIDTGLAHAVAQSAGAVMGGGGGGSMGAQSASPYVYPPPLFGRLDDPFFGYVPPLISFPPWWSRGAQGGATMQPGPAASMTPAPASNGTAAAGPQSEWRPLEVDAVKGQVDVSVDISGQVFLRGSVVSEQAAREIIDSARSVPGVTNVVGEIQVIPRRDPANDRPPPPPMPMAGQDFPGPAPAPGPAAEPNIVPVRPRPVGAVAAPTALDSQALSRRVTSSLERRPQAAGLSVKVRSSDGVVTLSGQVLTAFEAMLVYRATQQTPGVREIIDHLEFTVPDEDHENPLLQRGRPEDVEPYLTSQIRRHVGDLAHIDRVSARGNVLDLHGTIQNAGDQERVLAILRSIPVLHGFKLETQFNPE
jgi:osmotically-inducible protein OsmY